MKQLLFVPLLLVVVSVATAGDKPEIKGRGNWGRETQGVVCRITTDKTEYTIGDKVFILVEVKNTTDKPVALGLEPLIEVGDGDMVRQPAEIHSTFSQESNGQLGFFCTTVSPFPKGTKSEAKAVSVGPGKTYSEIVTRIPWGPCYGCIPSSAQPGKMVLRVSLGQFLGGDIKKQLVLSNEIELTVRAKQEDSNEGK